MASCVYFCEDVNTEQQIADSKPEAAITTTTNLIPRNSTEIGVRENAKRGMCHSSKTVTMWP